MGSRLTQHDVEADLRRLNERMGRPTESYRREDDGTYHAQAGCLHLSGAYGGWQLQESMAPGGIRAVTSGYAPLREVATFIDGMTAALDALLPRDEYGRVSSWDVDYHATPRA